MNPKRRADSRYRQMTLPPETGRTNLWASLASRPPTGEDQREIAANLTGFFGVLAAWDSAEHGVSGDRLESYDAHKHRLWQAEELLRSLCYREVPTPDGTVWERAEDDAVESARGEGGPGGTLFVGHVEVCPHVVSFSRDWNEALLAQSTASEILRLEMSDKWALDFAEKLTTAGLAWICWIYFYVTNTADGLRIDTLSTASGYKVISESGILPTPTRGTT